MSVRVETFLTGVRCAGISVDREQNLLFLEQEKSTAERLVKGERVEILSGLWVSPFNGIVGDSLGNVWIADSFNKVIKRVGVDRTVSQFKLEKPPRALCLDDQQN